MNKTIYNKDFINIIKNINCQTPVMTNDATEKVKNGTKAVDVLFNQEKVQQILKTVKYVKEEKK